MSEASILLNLHVVIIKIMCKEFKLQNCINMKGVKLMHLQANFKKTNSKARFTCVHKIG